MMTKARMESETKVDGMCGNHAFYMHICRKYTYMTFMHMSIFYTYIQYAFILINIFSSFNLEKICKDISNTNYVSLMYKI